MAAFVLHVGDLHETQCVQGERVVAGDNKVRCGKLALQIPENRHHRVKARVWVHAHPEGDQAVFQGQICIDRCGPTAA